MTANTLPQAVDKEPTAAWPFVIVIAAAVLTMGWLINGDFTTWDDNSTISQNSHMNPPSLANAVYYWTHEGGSLYIPFTYTIWSILAYVAKLNQADAAGIAFNPQVFHFANIVVHCCSAILVLSILTLLTHDRAASVLGALLFAVHPVQVETVGWISGLKDLLWGCLALASIYQYLQYAGHSVTHLANESINPRSETTYGRRWLHYSFAILFFLLAMLSKPTAMVTPAIIVSIDWLLLHRPWRSIVRSTVPFFVLSVPCMIITRIVQPGAAVDGGPLWARPLFAGDTLAFYIFKLLWPAQLCVDYGRRPAAIMASITFGWSCIVPATIAVIAWWQLRRRPWIAASAAVFILGTLPMIGLVPFAFEFFTIPADHYLYVSMLGTAMLLAFSLTEAVRYRKLVILGCCGLLSILAVRSMLQTQVWMNTEILLRHTLSVNPKSFGAYDLLAQVEIDAGRYTAAEPLLRESLKIEPRLPRAHDGLATVLIKTNRTDEAIEHIKIYIKSASDATPTLRKQLVDAHVTLGLYYFKHNLFDKAAEEFRVTLKLQPDNTTVKSMLQQAEKASSVH